MSFYYEDPKGRFNSFPFFSIKLATNTLFLKHVSKSFGKVADLMATSRRAFSFRKHVNLYREYVRNLCLRAIFRSLTGMR